MYLNILEEDIPEIFKESANAILTFFAKEKDNDIESYISRINKCKYIIIPEDLDVNVIEFSLEQNGKTYTLQRDLVESVIGEYCPLIYCEEENIIKEDIIILNTKELDITDEEVKHHFLIKTSIHEILHMLFSQFHGENLYTGFAKVNYQRLEDSIFLDYNDIKNNSVNEAVTDALAEKIYGSIYQKDYTDTYEVIDGEKYTHCSLYFINVKTINMMSYKIIKNLFVLYKNNRITDFSDILMENFEITLETLNNFMEVCSYYMLKLSEGSEELDCFNIIYNITDYIIENLYKISVILVKPEERKDVKEYFSKCLDNEYLYNSFLNIMRWQRDLENVE